MSPFIEQSDLAKLIADRSDLQRITQGADWTEPAEGTYATNGQTWARLLAMTPEERDKFLTMLQESASKGMACYMLAHDELHDELRFARQMVAAERGHADYLKSGWIADRVRLKRALRIAHHWRNFARNLQDYLDGKHEMEKS